MQRSGSADERCTIWLFDQQLTPRPQSAVRSVCFASNRHDGKVYGASSVLRRSSSGNSRSFETRFDEESPSLHRRLHEMRLQRLLESPLRRICLSSVSASLVWRRSFAVSRPRIFRGVSTPPMIIRETRFLSPPLPLLLHCARLILIKRLLAWKRTELE